VNLYLYMPIHQRWSGIWTQSDYLRKPYLFLKLTDPPIPNTSSFQSCSQCIFHTSFYRDKNTSLNPDVITTKILLQWNQKHSAHFIRLLLKCRLFSEAALSVDVIQRQMRKTVMNGE
jgi:hypothetical protein